MTKDTRLQQLTDWVHQDFPNASIEVASADASFRRYFRVTPNNPDTNHATLIAMDAPPEHEDCSPFLDVTQRLRDANVHAPEIIKESLEQGFLLLEDFGSTPYLDVLNNESADALYCDALNELINIQQPQAFVHRDYHSRNLMVIDKNNQKSSQNTGVIDYQDAVLGPITYDLVSILRDCYIVWPVEQVESWALQFKAQLEKAERIENTKDETFIQWFDYMGLQRHLKVLGIFARLNHRDGKTNYLDDLPLTLSYLMNRWS
ncbi:N-acetylmuramate/N-acetylglucosamine kinase [Nymphon striatum]|nr:N-acetylmuramate/N-acetylglucosamine kinase [Nymphon striatum]